MRKNIYICVGDNAQKWEKTHIQFESRENGMGQVKGVNDLSREYKTQKITSMIRIILLHDSSHWFKSNNSMIRIINT